MKPPTVREIAGLKYREIQSGNLQHDIYMMRLARLTGMDKIQSRQGESREDFAVRVHWQVLETDRVFEMLGGILIPDALADADWTPQIAAKTAALLKTLTAEEDKKQSKDALMQFNAFLAAGLLSSEGSRIASAETEMQPEKEQAATAS